MGRNKVNKSTREGNSECVCAGGVNEDNRTERIVDGHIHTRTVSAGPLGSECRSRGSSRPTLSSQWEADFHSETFQHRRFIAAERLRPRLSLRQGKRGGRYSRMGKVDKLYGAKALHEREGAASVCEANASLFRPARCCSGGKISRLGVPACSRQISAVAQQMQSFSIMEGE